MAQQLAQRDAALEAFDELRVREVNAWNSDNPSTFLARLQATAASLEPEERVELAVHTHKDTGLLKAVLADPHTNKVCALRWEYDGEEDANPIIPLLTSNCPELASLSVFFENHSAFDFVSSVLEHPRSSIKVLEMFEYTGGNLPRFFAALGQSQVSALTLFSDGSPDFTQGLCEHLGKDLLVRFKVGMDNKRVPSETMVLLTKCTRLTVLEWDGCQFPQLTAFAHLPKSITKLVLRECTVGGGFDWSFLVDSGVRELDFFRVEGAGGSHLGGALAAYLRAKGLDELRLRYCDSVNETLAAVGGELGRIERLDLDGHLDDASIALIALTLQSSNSELRQLSLPYFWRTMSRIENLVVPALRHPNCSLVKLSLSVYEREHNAAAKAVEDRFYKRRALLVLLQGQQVRRLYCPLRRLPVEMFRMVGEVLM